MEGENNFGAFGAADRDMQTVGAIKFELELAKPIRDSLGNGQLSFSNANGDPSGRSIHTFPSKDLSYQAGTVSFPPRLETKVNVIVICFIKKLPRRN